jgi:hypothetical protein
VVWYRERRASLSKAAEVAGVSISEMMDFLAEHGIPADLRVEDYREGAPDLSLDLVKIPSARSPLVRGLLLLQRRILPIDRYKLPIIAP